MTDEDAEDLMFRLLAKCEKHRNTSAESVQPEGYAHFKVGDNLRSIHEPDRQPVAVTEVAGWKLPRVGESVQSAGERIVGTVFDNTAASHETLKRTMIERIDAAILSAEKAAIAKERERVKNLG